MGSSFLGKRETDERISSFFENSQEAFATPIVVRGRSKFCVLAEIIIYLKALHQDGTDRALTLEEILYETNQVDIGIEITQWLKNEALGRSPKIKTTSDGRYAFNPPYKVSDGKDLLKLLRKHNLNGYGGIWLKDIEESLPNCANILKKLDNKIIYITRRTDPANKILFYNDKTVLLPVDEEFQQLWRSVRVDETDGSIEEYLVNQGIRTMMGTIPPPVLPVKLKSIKAAPKKQTLKRPRDNDHLKEILEEYDESVDC